MDILKQVRNKRFEHEVAKSIVAVLALTALTSVCSFLHLNLATASLLYIVVIVLVSSVGSPASSIVGSIVGVLCLVILAPPAYSFRVEDPFDEVAIVAFLITSMIVARLVFRLRRMTDEAISSVDRRLVDAEERERARVARELHDDVNQRLALVSLNLERFEGDLTRLDPTVLPCLREIREQISNLATDITALSHRLHSSKLELLGIVGAAKGLCKELCEKHVVEIEVHSEEVPKSLPQEIAVSLFRVLQEALRNAVKHSRSGHFEVRLSGIPGGIELSVHDTGVGFDPEAALKSRGLGLISMQERIKLVKGEFSIASQVNRGTTIHARVPLS